MILVTMRYDGADEEIRTPDRPRANRLTGACHLKADALLCSIERRPLCHIRAIIFF
jgi:hypothetical protein